jgi:AbrB family looped-hinge helix DNA binding protein
MTMGSGFLLSTRLLQMAAKLVEYLATMGLGERGTMTLPKEYRDALKLEPGTPMTVLRIGEGLILIPEQKRFDQLCDAIAARLEHSGISEAALQTTLPEVREHLMRRRYPGFFSTDRSKPSKSKNAVKGRRQG